MCLLVSGSFSTTFSFCFATFSLAGNGHVSMDLSPRQSQPLPMPKGRFWTNHVTLHHKKSAQSLMYDEARKTFKTSVVLSSQQIHESDLFHSTKPSSPIKKNIISFQVAFLGGTNSKECQPGQPYHYPNWFWPSYTSDFMASSTLVL